MHSIKKLSLLLLINSVFSTSAMEPAHDHATLDDYVLAHEEYLTKQEESSALDSQASPLRMESIFGNNAPLPEPEPLSSTVSSNWTPEELALLETARAFNKHVLPESLKNYDLSSYTNQALPTWKRACAVPDWYVVKGRIPCPNVKCKGIFARSDEMLAHLRTHRERRFFCDSCSFKALSPSTLALHKQRIHAKSVRLIACTWPWCAVKYALKKDLNKHMETHVESVPPKRN